jgi:hypothetical protein
MMRGHVYVSDRMVGNADVSRGQALLEAIAGRNKFPRQPGPYLTGVSASEDHFQENVSASSHGAVS